MSEQIENICAGAGSAMEADKAEQEAMMEASKKGQGGDAVITHDGGDPAGQSQVVKTPARKSNSRSTSPANKDSKRKRKNRKRRQKKDALAASGGSESELGTGTEEVSITSEEISKGADDSIGAGTDIENELDNSMVADTSMVNKTVTSSEYGTPTGDDSVSAAERMLINDREEALQNAAACGVGTLSEIAKQKVEDAEKQQCKVAERQKSSTKTVHFDEGPPKVLPAAAGSSGSAGDIPALDLGKDGVMGELAQSKSRETVILVEKVAATDSSASMESAGSLLKGSGSSCEAVDVGSAYHYPSLEAVEGQSQGGASSGASLEAVQSFKEKNPEQTKNIKEQVEQILSTGVEKISIIKNQPKSGAEPVLTSYKARDDDGDLQKQELAPKPGSSGNVNISARDIPAAAGSGSEINRTFIVEPSEEGESGDADDYAPSPVLPGPSPALETQKIPADPNLSVVFEVPEEDPTLEQSPPHKTVSEASTVYEALSVQYIPSDNATQQKSSDTNAANANNSNEVLHNSFIRDTESEVDSEDGKQPGGPMELLTFHFPPTDASASASRQEINFDGGDQPYMNAAAGSSNAILENDITGSGHPSPPTSVKDARGDPNYDTESDCPWLPERVESLTKVISKKEKQGNSSGNAAAGTSTGSKQDRKTSMKRAKGGASASNSENNLDEPGQGCNCAKMCVVM